MTNDRGGIIDDLIVYRLDDFRYFLVVNAANRETDFAWLREREIPGSDVRDVSDEYALLAVQGPRAIERLGLSPAPQFTFAEGEIDGVQCMVNRTGYTGEEGCGADGHGRALHPQLAGVLGHGHQLAALLAGVAGAVDHALDTVDLPFGKGELGRRRQAQALDCPRALHGQQRILVGDVADVGAWNLAFPQPSKICLAIGRIDDEEIAEVVEPIDDQVVDDPAAVVRQERVLRLPGLQLDEVVRQRRLQQLGRARPLDLELAHVRDVEDPGVTAHGLVLPDHPCVLNRHLPARKRNEPSAERDVAIVKRGPEQCLGHRGRC